MKKLLDDIIELTSTAGTRPCETGVPGLVMIKGNVPAHQLAAFYQPIIGFVVQGMKTLSIGGRDITIKAPSYFVLPMDVPVTGTVRSGPDGSPYLSLGLSIDRTSLQDLLKDLPEDFAPGYSRNFTSCEANHDLVEAWLRLLRLKDTPRDVPALAPVYGREILYRVLLGPQGWYLRQLGLKDSNLTRISKIVSWLRENYAEPIDIRAVADKAAMAVTTFHRVFKRATGLSPIQFQKQVRLIEARNLAAFEGYTAAGAAYKVGYQSVSQFNREYTRFFGAPPARHAALVRQIENTRSV